MSVSSLTSVLNRLKNVDNRGVTFISGALVDDFLSYQALYNNALKGLYYLQNKGLRPGQEVILLIENNKTFVIAFWSCILGGLIPVPLSTGQSEDHRRKPFAVWQVLNNPFLLTSPGQLQKMDELAIGEHIELFSAISEKWLNTDDFVNCGGAGDPASVAENDIAFIQFSSGSTGAPKGVVLTHGNLIANMEAISTAACYSATDSLISWMPLTHDMGLIGFHLNPIFKGINQYLIPTALFIRRPSIWLDKVHQYQCSVLSSPNFGYHYVVKHGQPGTNWDFSHVRIIFNGAEPISKQLCDRFISYMHPFGLPENVMRPVYGLAEGTLAVSMSELNKPLIVVTCDRTQVNIGDRIVPGSGSENLVSFVGVGKAVPHCSFRITNNEYESVDEGIIGHVQIQGTNVTSGYYNDKLQTAEVLTGDGWLKTGDLGFIKEDELFVTGRAKDMIINNGQNIYPHDIESSAQSIDGIELNKIAIGGFFNSQTECEETVAFVFHRADLHSFVPIYRALKRHVSTSFGLDLNHILPVRQIPRTTSGKLQRFKLLEEYRQGLFKAAENELREILEQQRMSNESYVDKTAQCLSEIWKQILESDDIYPDQSFFEIGGDSLKVTALQQRIAQQFDVSLSIEDIYNSETLSEQVNLIDQRDKEQPEEILPAPKSTLYPLSPAQRRVYYAWQMEPFSTAYNLPVAFQLKGNLSTSKLEECIRKLIKQHSALRISFEIDGSQLAFRINEMVDFKLEILDIGNSDVDRILKDLVRPFRSDTPPLFRAFLLNKNVDEHILLLDFHHIIYDGISVHQFVEQLFKLYSGLTLVADGIDYQDYTNWINGRNAQEKKDRSFNYWLNHLQNRPATINPTDFPRTTGSDYRGSRTGFTIQPEEKLLLRRLAAEQECSLHSIMLTFYFILLSKFSGQYEHAIGIPVSDRPHASLQTVQGIFVNNLVILTSIDPTASFIDALKLVRTAVKNALRHSHYDYELLGQHLDQRNQYGQKILFDTMFTYQDMGLPSISNCGITLARHFFDPGTSKFDLSMEIFDFDNQLQVEIEYSSSLYRKETIVQLLASYRNLMDHILMDISVSLSSLSTLSASDYSSYVNDFNSTQVRFTHSGTVHELIKKNYKDKASHPAVEQNGVIISYGDLNNQVIELSAKLKPRLRNTNGIVSIKMRRSANLIVAMLASWEAGASYLPVDHEIKLDRFERILEDSRCSVILTDEIGGNLFSDPQDPDSTVTRYEKDTASAEIHMYYREQIQQPRFKNLAYVIYTSGSTGTPKGVMIGHPQLLNYVNWAAECYIGHGPGNTALFTSIGFDLSITAIFPPLVKGQTIIIYDERSPYHALEKIMQDNKTHLLKLTPSHLKILKDSSIEPLNISCLQKIVVGGEQLTASLADEIVNLFDGCVTLYNEYGPTETTVGSMIHLYNQQMNRGPFVSIGKPIANTQIYLLDPWLNPVQKETIGEIYIGGAGLAEGYLYQPKLTDLVFIANPFLAGTKIYKTGDMAKRTSGGQIEYHGRRDTQVKINGFRVELSEIERHILSVDKVKQSVVVSNLNENGTASIYAYYIPNAQNDHEALKDELRKKLTITLPYYMIPVNFICVDEFPLTANGKLDIARLLPPESTPKAGSEQKSSLEEILLESWEQIFNQKGISAEDDFFILGGDSIKAVQISSRLNEQGIRLKTRDILSKPTIAHLLPLAELMESHSRNSQAVLAGRRDLLPAERWFIRQNLKKPGFYNQSVLLQLNKELSLENIQTAFKILIRHHDGLRVNYDRASGQCFYNNVHLEQPFFLSEITVDSKMWMIYQQKPEAAAAVLNFFQTIKASLDLQHDLLLKAGLVRVVNGNTYLFITAHHLLVDGVSWRILLNDLYALCRDLEEGSSVQLPPKSASAELWLDYVKLHSQTNLHEDFYWQEIDRHRKPLGNVRSKQRTVQNRISITCKINEQDSRFLTGAANSIYQTDTAILLNTALALALKSWLQTPSFVLETENHGRHIDEVDLGRTTGWFTAIFPVLITVEQSGIGNLIQSIKAAYQQTPGKGLGYQMKDRTAGVLPVALPVRLNYLGQFDSEFENDLFTYSLVTTGTDVAPENQMNAFLEIDALVINKELILQIGCHQEDFSNDNLSKFLTDLKDSLALMIQHLKSAEHQESGAISYSRAFLSQADIDTLFD